MRDGRLVRHCASTVEARDDLSLTKTGAPVTLSAAIIEMDLRLRRSHQIIDPSPLHLPFLLFCFRNFYYSPLSLSLEISSNGEIKERISKIISLPFLRVKKNRLIQFQRIRKIEPFENSRSNSRQSIERLRHAPHALLQRLLVRNAH